jgi:hypothetical protein
MGLGVAGPTLGNLSLDPLGVRMAVSRCISMIDTDI